MTGFICIFNFLEYNLHKVLGAWYLSILGESTETFTGQGAFLYFMRSSPDCLAPAIILGKFLKNQF